MTELTDQSPRPTLKTQYDVNKKTKPLVVGWLLVENFGCWLYNVIIIIDGDIPIMLGSSISWNLKLPVPTMAMYQCANGRQGPQVGPKVGPPGHTGISGCSTGTGM